MRGALGISAQARRGEAGAESVAGFAWRWVVPGVGVGPTPTGVVLSREGAAPVSRSRERSGDEGVSVTNRRG